MAERTYKRIAVEEGFNFPEIMSEAVKVAAQQPPLIKALSVVCASSWSDKPR